MNGVSSETLRLILDVRNKMSRELAGAHSNIKKVDKELDRVKGGFKEASSGAKKFANVLKSAFSIAAIAFAAKKVFEFGKSVIKLGSDAEEIQSKFNTVFKHLTKQADKWTKKFSKDVGRSANAMRGFMSTFQDTFVPLGFAREQGLSFSKTLVQLGVDLASFNNLAEADVMRDLQSGIVGNTEVFRKYGVIINQVTLNQELLNMGIEGGAKAATEAQKAQARLNLVLKGTTDAQGDAIRTGAGFANTMRKMAATSERVMTGLGKALLPVATNIANSINAAMEPFATWIEDNELQITNFFLNIPQIAAVVFKSIIPILGDIFTGVDFFKIVESMVSILTTGFEAAVFNFIDFLGAAILSIPDLLVAAVGNLGGLLNDAMNKAFLPAQLGAPEPWGVEQFMKEGIEDYLPGRTLFEPKTAPGVFDSKQLQKAYNQYLKDWREANKEQLALRKEIDDANTKAMDTVMRNFSPALEKSTERLTKAFEVIQENIKDIGKEGSKVIDGPGMVNMLTEISEILNNPLLKATEKTADNTTKLTKKVKPSGLRKAKTRLISNIQELPAEVPVEVDMLNETLSSVTSRLGEFGSSLVNNIEMMGPIGILFTLLEPVLDGIFSILSPAIEDVLRPLFEVLELLGESIGTLILPLFKLIEPVILALVWAIEGLISFLNLFSSETSVAGSVAGVGSGQVEENRSISPIVLDAGLTGVSRGTQSVRNTYVIVRADGIIDEEAEKRVSLRIGKTLDDIKEAGG